MNKNTEHKNKITPKREQDTLSFEPDDFKTNRSLATIGQELGGEWEAFGGLRYGELLNQNGVGGWGVAEKGAMNVPATESQLSAPLSCLISSDQTGLQNS